MEFFSAFYILFDFLSQNDLNNRKLKKKKIRNRKLRGLSKFVHKLRIAIEQTEFYLYSGYLLEILYPSSMDPQLFPTYADICFFMSAFAKYTNTGPDITRN